MSLLKVRLFATCTLLNATVKAHYITVVPPAVLITPSGEALLVLSYGNTYLLFLQWLKLAISN